MEAQIQLGDTVLSYELRRSSRRRTLAVAIDPQDGLVVYSPARLSGDGVRDFLQQKASWILFHLQRLEAARSQVPVVNWEPGSTVPLLGRRIPLRVEPGATRGRVEVEADCLVVHTPPEDGLLPLPARVRELAVVWLRRQAERTVTERVAVFAPLVQAAPRVVRVRDQKRRWGSCSAQGALNFNWRLVLAPPEVLDYVVVHELCHLKELNHSPRFWAHVGLVLPEYRRLRAWLREHGALLDV
jgi:predicted metal-dependent hydrolase